MLSQATVVVHIDTMAKSGMTFLPVNQLGCSCAQESNCRYLDGFDSAHARI